MRSKAPSKPSRYSKVSYQIPDVEEIVVQVVNKKTLAESFTLMTLGEWKIFWNEYRHDTKRYYVAMSKDSANNNSLYARMRDNGSLKRYYDEKR